MKSSVGKQQNGVINVKMKKKIFLATEQFPFGNVERVFIQEEYEKLKEEYDITIFSHSDKASDNDTWCDKEIEVINVNTRLNILKLVKFLMLFLIDKDAWCEVSNIIKTKGKRLYKIYESFVFYARALNDWYNIRDVILSYKNQEILYYSYWYYYYTYAITRKKNKFKKIKIITRTHGFDLYDERCRCGRQPFKTIMDRNLDKVIFACQYAKQYYTSKINNIDFDKYIVSEIGTKSGSLNIKQQKNNVFLIVSCSSVIPLKRVNLIIDGLSIVDNCNIEWHHFGNGTEYEKIKKYAKEKLEKSKFVNYKFHGYMKNEEILQYYSQNYINCFITTSESEGGAPVSIQEALAFGIPVIGTKIGGITEMINGNGILISETPSKIEVKNAIEKISMLDNIDYIDMRKKSYELWNQKYQAKENAKRFINILTSIWDK